MNPTLEITIVTIIVALAAIVLVRRAVRFFASSGNASCGTKCGSCPSAGEKSLVNLEMKFKR